MESTIYKVWNRMSSSSYFPPPVRLVEIPKDVHDLIRQMSDAKTLWGAPRIHGELLKLGIEISQATGSKYMARYRKPPSQTGTRRTADQVDHGR